jgi:Abortive infection alpha
MSQSDEAKTLGTALTIAKDYADLVIKGPLGEIGGVLTDTLGHWRLRNQVRLLLKTKQWLEEKGVDPKPIMPEVLVPLLQDASNVEDESLSGMFSALLANHLDSSQQERIHPSYTKVLSQLSPLDARVMLHFRKWVSYQGAREVGLRGRGVTAMEVAEALGCSERSAYLSCLNLNRLGIVEHKGFRPPEGHPISALFTESPEHQMYLATEYGVEFCDACHYPSEKTDV